MGALLPPAEAHVFPKLQALGDAVQALLADEFRPQARHASLRNGGNLTIEKIGSDVAQDGIAQELQTLIVLFSGIMPFIGKGAVGQGCFQQLAVPKAVTDGFFQLPHITLFSASYRRYER